MADRIEAGFSLNKRAKRDENKSDWHHVQGCHRFRDIRLQLSQLGFGEKLFFTYTNETVYILHSYSKILVSWREIKSFVFGIFRPFQNDIY